MGMVHAARISELGGFSPAGTRTRLEEALAGYGLPVRAPTLDRRAQLAALKVDKNRVDGRIRYVVLRGIGRAEITELSPAEILPRRKV